jgi:hypothetical protein
MLNLRINYAIGTMIAQIVGLKDAAKVVCFILLQIQPKLGITLFYYGLKLQSFFNIEI